MSDETEIVYMFVPYKPTPEMLKAGGAWSALPEQTWQDMLDASPEIDREEGGSEVKSLPTQTDIANALIDSGINEKISVVEIEALLVALDARSPSTAVRSALTNTAVSRQALRAIRYLAESPSGREPHDRFSMIAAYCEQGLEEDARPQSAAVRDYVVPIHKDGNYVFIDGPGDVELDHGGKMRSVIEAVMNFMPLAEVAFLWTKETPPKEEVDRYREAYWSVRAALHSPTDEERSR